MRTAVADAPRLIHAIPGRVRIHVPARSGQCPHTLESSLAELPGFRSVQANDLTGNLLVQFDPQATNEQAVLEALRRTYLDGGSGADKPDSSNTSGLPVKPNALPRPQRHLKVQQERQAHTVRARIAVPGMDRSPHLARHVAAHLATNHPGVHARVSMLTGRVLVEFDEHEDDLDDLCAELTGMDLPDILDADQPADPLDPGPLVQSATRTAGATIGLTLISARRVAGRQHPFDPAGAVQATAVVGILSGFPLVRDGLRRLFGRDAADILLSVPAIIGLALSDSPLGLLLSAAEGLRLLTEVVTRRAAWRRFEARLLDSPTPVPGTVVRVESGERAPLSATVLEGVGTATGRDGLPTRLTPGETVVAGARLYGGSFVLELETPEGFTPAPRPAPMAPTLYTRYSQLAVPVSLAYAALSAVLSRSATRALEGMLLVSPRTAVIGMEAAEIGAAARVLRAGVTNVGTRRNRSVRFPHILLLDGPGVLTDGFEIEAILSDDETWEVGVVATHAAAISAAAGSPWGTVFPTATGVRASDGTFDGETASAQIAGIRYMLGPVLDWSSVPAALYSRGGQTHTLELCDEREAHPLGYLVLRPRLAHGASDLVETCRRHGVAIGLVIANDSDVARDVAVRGSIPVFSNIDAPTAIRSKQAMGKCVAFVSDHAHAAAAFDAADLAIGIADPYSHLPARADLIAPDLTAVAAIIEAGARADLGTRGSVVLSLIANCAGAIWGLGGQVGLELASEAVYFTSLAALTWDWLVLRGGHRPHAVHVVPAATDSSWLELRGRRDGDDVTADRVPVLSPRSAAPRVHATRSQQQR